MSEVVKPHVRSLQLGSGWAPEEAGGIQRVYHELLRYLPQSGVEVHGLVAGSSRVARDSRGRVRAFAPSSKPLLVRWQALRREMRRMLIQWDPDLIASHFALYTFPVLDLIRPRPLIVHFHGPWALESQYEGDRGLTVWIKALLEQTVYRRGARSIVLSHAFGDVLHHRYGVPAERIRVIPGGVDTDRFATELTKREAQERLGWPQDRPIVLAVRRLVRRMGLENLIMAISLVRERVPDVLLLVAGTGPLAESLSVRVRALGLENNVQLLGFVFDEDLPIAYRASDLTVVPTSTLEGFGLVAVESLAAGTPALVTPVAGLPEVVRQLSTDLVLPDSDSGALAEGLAAALMGDLTLPSSDVCRAYARARYDWSVVAAFVRGVYAEALP